MHPELSADTGTDVTDYRYTEKYRDTSVKGAPFHHIPTAKRMLEEFPKWKDTSR